MAYNKDQNEPKVPISNVQQRTSSDLLPRFYRTKGNKKFLQATLDQLIQPGTVKKINGYIGRKTAKAVQTGDIFLEAADNNRQNYQLEPAAIVQDYLGNTTFFKDYIDHINHIDVFDGNTKNHSRLNKEEFYAWNPHISWDKFVNYQQYYWLPFGPDPIEVLGNQLAIQSTYTVKGVDEEDNVAYLFTPNGLTRNPTLRLFRGQTYTFDIDAEGHPFSIKTRRVSGSLDRYNYGVDQQGVEKGTITFTVPVNAPDVLFYVSDNAVDTGGVFHIFDIDENTSIDLTQDFLGKKDYIIPNGTSKGLKISNGMKLSFGGQVTPEKYGTGYWYVEGVGTEIVLVADTDLEVRTSYNVESNILFDDMPFDQLPFGDASTLPSKKDYITINRGSPDLNPWTRYNRWFHKDVVAASAAANGQVADLDQNYRATRPIIEFQAGIKLHNYGTFSKLAVDVIDNFTTDVFSTVEGSLGYNVDGIDLAEGMRVLFTADTDSMVQNKIFKVNFIEVTPPSRQIAFDPEVAVDINNNTFTFTSEHGLNSFTRLSYLTNGNAAISGLVNREVYYVKVLDTFKIELHSTPQLNKQVDIFALASGVHKFEIYPGKRRQIYLQPTEDTDPVIYETVTVKYGTNDNIDQTLRGNQGQTYWFDGTTWKLAQLKTTVNQSPLFDVFDADGYSYSDKSVYDGSTFTGTKIFSYRSGTGTADSVLGFPLTYKNINNIGDIVFDFNLLTDSFAYKNVIDVLYKNTDVGYLKIIVDKDRYNFENAWTTSLITDNQPVVRVFEGLTEVSSSVNTNSLYVSDTGVIYEYNTADLKWYPRKFPIDVFNGSDYLSSFSVKLYVNGKRLDKAYFTIETGVAKNYVAITANLNLTDVVTLRCFANAHKNSNGYYELPGSLQNNPLNNNVQQFTLGEVIDHVDSIVDNISNFEGFYPGDGNLRDIGNLSAYGTRFVQHSGPMNLSLYHLGSKNANVIKALDKARTEYGNFKRAFIIAATESGIDTDPRRHVDYVLQAINKDKPKTSPYFLSDMFGYTASNRLEYTVLDSRIKKYPLTEAFNLQNLSNKSVNIYLNGEQLIHGKDYVFGDDIYFEILAELQDDDLIEAYEYVTTDGCFCPATPTKLGIYPKFEPKKYVDDTYVEPTEVIQGHDGSITIAFGDYRDDLILELEKRIFNNIKVEYDPSIFDIWDYVPGYNRTTDYTREEFDKILAKYFFQWTLNIQQDYTKHVGYDSTNSFTYNYRGNYTPDLKEVPAYWRGTYKWLFDTDRPHTNPWECLGFSLEPKWWQEVYGPAPYTSDNLLLWDDIKEGIIREPGVPVRRNPKFAKPILSTGIPVDDQGKLISPLDAGLVQGFIRYNDSGYFVFGDQSTVEAAWRRSSYLPFAVIQTCLLMQPNTVLGRCLDRSRIVRNLNNQLIYSDTGLRIRLKDLLIPSTANRNNNNRVYTCGLINYVVDYLTSENTARIDQYATDLENLTNKISTKLGAFTSQAKYKILLDSKTPSSSGGVFVPEENYFVNLNVSSAVKKVIYSGVIITKFTDGFEIRGYNFDNPYFTYFGFRQDDRVINVGGISESYINWNPGQIYVAGKLVKANNQYYRVKTTHTSGEVFDESNFARLAQLPVIGGREVMLRKSFDAEDVNTIAYGTKLTTIQEVVDFIQGYGAYLENLGFVFDDFNNELGLITNWETSVKEFLFWTTQNWNAGAVISLSPAADKLIFRSDNAVVGDITDQFYGYSVYRVDGQKLDPEFITTFRSNGEFVIEPENTNYGIFGITLHLLQKEHIVVFDNETLFNDTIYDQEAGYRQERVKVLGYVTSNWKGSFEIPGFIYDQAIIKSWEPWTDYRLGDIVKHKEFYYSASKFLIGTLEFEDENWILLEEKPTPELLPNWDYKAETFTDFYDLDTDNFDAGQQKIAQHLIGYQKRQYLENIIQNDVSQYKFYQGMIIEKGTQNVLNKLFDVLSADGQESLTFDEEWAFRVGEYGAVDTFNEIEFVLNESKFKINPQPLELVTTVDPSVNDFVYRQSPADVYIKPLGYVNDIWPTSNVTPFLRTPGYVRVEDVKVNVNNLSNLETVDIADFKEGDYVWCAFENRSWNVYRFTQTDFVIRDITYANNVITFVCDRTLQLSAGNVVGIEGTASVNGFHTVATVSLNKFTVRKEVQGWQPFAETDTVISYVLTPHRTNNIDNANSIIPKNIKLGELMWVDNDGSDKWAVYKNQGVFRKGIISNSDPRANLEFGRTTAIDQSGTVAAIATVDTVTVFTKGSNDNAWNAFEILAPGSAITPTTKFGSTLRFSDDSKWLAVAVDNATALDGVTLNAGAVSLYKKSPSGSYRFVTTLRSPTPAAGENFGSNITFGKKSNPETLYTAQAGTYDGDGSGALWNVKRSGSAYSVSVAIKGVGYSIGDTIVILGESLGGITGDNDLTITVNNVNPSTGAIESFVAVGFGLPDTYFLAVSAIGYNAGQGRVYTYKYAASTDDVIAPWEYLGNLTSAAGELFGYDTDMSATGGKLVISAPAADSNSGKVFVYSYNSTLDSYQWFQTINRTADDDAERFGESVVISADGNYIAISAPVINVGSKADVGQVLIYKRPNNLTSEEHILYQTVNSPRNEVNEQFGTDLEFMNDGETLVVFSKFGDIETVYEFDNGSTTFDNNSLRVVDLAVNVGRIDIFDKYNTKYIYGESLENNSVPYSGYGEEISVGNNIVLVSAINEADNGNSRSGNVYSYVKTVGDTSWEKLHYQLPKVDIKKIKKAFLYNKITNKIVKYLDIIDPNQGEIPGVADQEIKFKTFFDPATYSVGTDQVIVDEGMAWTTNQIGMLWWDLSNAKFVETQTGDVIYRTSSWNRLYDTASIDVYEWVETALTPAAWNKQADTEAGIAKGVSGKTKYGDNVYSVRKRYDAVSKTFKETYYYWVKNKKIVPNIEGRTLSAYDIASLIADPAGYGYSCIAFTGTNSLSLINCEKYLESTDVVLSIQYWLSDYKESNYHSQWKLLSTNRNTVIPSVLEVKWFHSLIGKDDNDRVVPDINLPVKQRYGIEFRPRQSMFVNRVEALKQLINRTNAALRTVLIADDYDLSDLNLSESAPSKISTEWDITVDTDAELRFVSTVLAQTASLTPTITDGRITGINIIRAGAGYGKLVPYALDEDGDPVSWYGPTVTVSGSGVGAVVKTVINSLGGIINTVILNSGEGYDNQTTTVVRDFSVLVLSDSSALDTWSVYSWNYGAREWLRIRSQSYNVTKYWKYIDWYETGYNQFIKIDHLVENTYELVTTNIEIGEVAKVKNVGRGGWLLLEKFNNVQTIDYTQNFKVVGRQDGTVEFLDNLYKFANTTQGFDGPLFDSDVFDNSPTTEIKIILEALRDKILIDELRVEYLKLFFASVRYAMYEQTFLDWAFKTSFVKSVHNVGDLKQKVTYNSDNLEFFEEYIKEVKPYRTTIREYVSNYAKLENSGTAVTDFDLLPVINENLEVKPLTVYSTITGQITTSYNEINDYPWAFWRDNLGFEITSLQVIAAGRGYVTRPVVEIIGPQLPGGVPAEAKAYIANGIVYRVDLTNPGSGYIKTPRVVIKGGVDPAEGRPASVIAFLGNGVIRTNYMKVKFDRVSKNLEITNLRQLETFTGNGTRTSWSLRWSPDILTGNSYVTVNGIELLRDQYTLEEVEPGRGTTTNLGYVPYSGRITFKEPPENRATILVEYNKDYRHLSATDRVNYYYNPTTGMLGKDFAQLMKGIDYGGVQITGLDFGVSVGWDALPWFTEPWDSVDPSFDDFIVTVDTVTYEFRMPYVPAEGQNINVYVSRYVSGSYIAAVRIDDPNYATINQTNENALMTTFVGDGEIDIIILPTSVVLNTNDRVIFRKDSSDGSYAPRDDDYDTQLTGGDLAYSSATGIAPDDIILDGDDLVSANTSHAPEEVVPGQIMDTVAIKVFHRPSGGCPNIMFTNYLIEAGKTEYIIGQYFPNNNSITVKLGNTVLSETIDYTVDYRNNTVTLLGTLTPGTVLTILSVGFNSANVLDLDHFIADGYTKEYITHANWLPTASAIVLVNGENVNYVLFATDEQYTGLVGQTWRSRIGIRFEDPPAADAIINYIIDSGNIEQNASIIKKETITYVNGTSTYELGNTVGINAPLDQNVLVKTASTYLKPASANYFDMLDGILNYSLLDYKYQGVAVNSADIKVYRDTELLTFGTDYSLDFDYSSTSYQVVESSIVVIGGYGYVVGDVLDAAGGSTGPDGDIIKVQVTRINSSGTIEEIELLNTGSYIAPPTSPFNLTGGTGSDAAIQADFEILEDRPNITVKLRGSAYRDNTKLTVLVTTNADYTINNDNTITFNTVLSLTSIPVEITSFYNHNVLGIERTIDTLIPATEVINGTSEYYELSGKLGGNFKLRNSAVAGDFVWVIKNGTLLMNNVDYVLEEDFITIRLKDYLFDTDTIQIIAFTNTVVHESFAYMQFKDMLNRVHYKRLNKSKSTLLAKDLFQTDKEIQVVDSSILDTPNPSKNVPGIIEISGERIEYFTKTGNILGQLRRGTLGTGTPYIHSKDSLVLNIGVSETIPYKDEFIVTTHTSDGISGVVELPYVPSKNDMEVFVGGVRMKKNAYKVYGKLDGSGNLIDPDYPNSPAGDITLPAEFNINGRAELQLTTVPAMGTKISVIKKQGKLWNDMGQRLAKSNNEIANFLTQTGTDWVETYLDKYENRVLGGDGSPLSTGDGEPLEY